MHAAVNKGESGSRKKERGNVTFSVAELKTSRTSATTTERVFVTWHVRVMPLSLPLFLHTQCLPPAHCSILVCFQKEFTRNARSSKAVDRVFYRCRFGRYNFGYWSLYRLSAKTACNGQYAFYRLIQHFFGQYEIYQPLSLPSTKFIL